MAALAVIIGVIVWSILSENNNPAPQPLNGASSKIFPVALLEKFCDRVDVDALETGFANPCSLIFISFLAPVVLALIELLQHLTKLHSQTVAASGSAVRKRMTAFLRSASGCVRTFGAYHTPTSQRAGSLVKNEANECLEHATESTTEELEEQVESHASDQIDSVQDKSDELQDQAAQAFDLDTESTAANESATYPEYKLAEAKAAAAMEEEIAQSTSFTLIHLGLAFAVAVDYTKQMNSVVIGESAMCRASKILVMPLFTAFALSMWNVLMTVTNYVHWEYSRTKTPKEVVEGKLIPAPTRPVNRNILIKIILLTTAGFMAIWVCAALVVAPALLGFLPVSLCLLVVVPMLVLVLPLSLVSWLWGFLPVNAAQLQIKRINVLQKTFERIDTDKNGTITKEELQHHWGVSGDRSTPVSLFVNRLWRKLDKDSDGEVHIDELMAAAGVGEEYKLLVNKEPTINAVVRVKPQKTGVKEEEDNSVDGDAKQEDNEDQKASSSGNDGQTESIFQWQRESVAVSGDVALPVAMMGKPLQVLLTAQPKLLLKVGLMQAFTTIMIIAWFAGVYYGHESWSSATKALFTGLPSLMIDLAVAWPSLAFSASFKLPTLDWPSTTLCFVSIGLIGAEYFQKAVAWLDKKLGDRAEKMHIVTAYAVGLIQVLG